MRSLVGGSHRRYSTPMKNYSMSRTRQQLLTMTSKSSHSHLAHIALLWNNESTKKSLAGFATHQHTLGPALLSESLGYCQ
jgi:hypothetical protein